MKFVKIMVVLVCLSFLASCTCPEMRKKAKRERVYVPQKIEIPKEVPPAPPAPPVKKEIPQVAKKEIPKEEGKATQTEIAKAIKGEEIHQVKIPEKKIFVEKVSFKNIYFDFDNYNLGPDASATLKNIGEYLLKNPEINVLIDGHCDERGTREYNLVLGEKRALSARRFLTVMGVSPKRLFTVSYGEDKPADPDSNEKAWAKNRRCEFKISSD